ncbi:MAG TPA: glycosyltransferase family 39 protein [bacterium]|nr:glycosyltransferase family 39 protein [bacterium]
MTQQQTIRLHILTLLVVLCLAIALRVPHSRFGLPRWPRSAELSFATGFPGSAWSAALGLGATDEPNLAHGWVADIVQRSSIDDARLAGAALGCISVLLVWVLARRLFGPFVALMAAAIAAVHPLASFWSRFALRETTAGVLFLAALILVTRSPEKKSRLAFLLAGFMLVFGAPAAVFGVLAGAAVLVIGARASRSPIGANAQWACIGAVGALFAHYLLGAKGGLPAGGFDALYTSAAPYAFDFGSMPILIAGSVGLGWAVVRARFRDVPWLSFVAAALVAGLLASGRDSVPGVASAPLVCILAAAGISGFFYMLKGSFRQPARLGWLAPVLALAVFMLPAIESISSLQNLSKKPTLDAAVDWLHAHAPRGAKIAVETQALALEPERYQTIAVESAGDNSPQVYRERGVHFLVIAESSVFAADREVMDRPKRLAGYAELLSHARSYGAFVTSDTSIGPMIIVIDL